MAQVPERLFGGQAELVMFDQALTDLECGDRPQSKLSVSRVSGGLGCWLRPQGSDRLRATSRRPSRVSSPGFDEAPANRPLTEASRPAGLTHL